MSKRTSKNVDPELERKRKIEADVVVATYTNASWGVVSLSGGSRNEECAPMVIYTGLDSREAAEFARLEVIGQCIDNGSVYGPSEVPLSHFNTLGCVIRELRESGVKDDLHAFARRVAEAATNKSSSFDDEIPF